MITEPPLEDGAVQDTKADPSDADAVTAVGTPGTVRGVTGELAEDAEPGPIEFVATTVKV